jgi:hypothetical protein
MHRSTRPVCLAAVEAVRVSAALLRCISTAAHTVHGTAAAAAAET